MLRVFLACLALGIVVLLGGFLYLGLHPPRAHPVEMHVVIPNSRFPGG